MSDQKREGTALAAGTALGLGIAAFFGVGLILAYLLFRRREDGALAGMLPAPAPGHAPTLLAGLSAAATPARALAQVTAGQEVLPARRAQETAVRTYTLPSITTNGDAFRLATAPGAAPSEVVVRVISPQGGLAVLAFSANELVGMNSLDGGTMVIPTGQHQRINLRPGQALYGKGHVPGVMVSVVQSAG